jgi:hypothetical protein
MNQRPRMSWTWSMTAGVVVSVGCWALILLVLRRLVEGHW